MSAKFTPGPWVVDIMSAHENANNCYSFLIRSNDWHISAIHNDPNENDFEGDEEEIANAHLIASSPDMYKDLNSLIMSITSHPDYVNGSEDDEWHTLVNSVNRTIAKAEGVDP